MIANTLRQAGFTLDDITRLAGMILAREPDAIVSTRLLGEVLRLPSSHPRIKQAKQAGYQSKWVRQLEQAQLPDGSWGRFHSQDTRVKSTFRTTEEAIDRAFALGLEPFDEVLTRVRDYILDVLHGATTITDRTEKNAAWPLIIKLILAGRLAQIDPGCHDLDPFWTYLHEVAWQAFASGEYRLEDEAAAFMRLSGIALPGGFLESQHALWILASRQLPAELDRVLVSWIWHKPDGVRYLRAPLADFEPRRVGFWFRSMDILSHFAAWREVCLNGLNRLWDQRDEDGLWDFGSGIAKLSEYPLSDSWHRGKRRLDYSTSVLVLLRKFFDGSGFVRLQG